jgi:asparagine synthase (glutamine-hydrolysing)
VTVPIYETSSAEQVRWIVDDSGAVLLVVYDTMRRLGLSPSRLKAFVLDLGEGPDVAQAREFLAAVGLSMLLEAIEESPATLDVVDTLRTIEDYKPLDVQCAAMGLALCRGIRARYPEWRHLADGDGGDENLKDYPIEENHELTIRSVIDNLLLYHEGWGVGRIKHSLTYSGGLSRSCVRTYAPLRRYGFVGFSPFMQPAVVEASEAIPFADLTRYDVPSLYALKGDIVRRGVRAITGLDMPVFPKRRFQHGALPADRLGTRLDGTEPAYRRAFHTLYA